jgi:hypothetical protein
VRRDQESIQGRMGKNTGELRITKEKRWRRRERKNEE